MYKRQAHECAHQILFQLDSDDRKIACHKRPEVRGNGSRVLRTQEDWNEWQANALGAAILMPQSEVDRAMWFINSRKPLTCYGWHFYDKDQVKIDTFCSVFGVSRSAAAIRLEQLGYLNRKKDYEYVQCLDTAGVLVFVVPLLQLSEECFGVLLGVRNIVHARQRFVQLVILILSFCPIILLL